MSIYEEKGAFNHIIIKNNNYFVYITGKYRFQRSGYSGHTNILFATVLGLWARLDVRKFRII